jgi:hypothetical protein
MTPRERILGVGVLVAIGAVAANYAFNSVRSGFQKKRDLLSNLESEVVRLDGVVLEGMRDRKKLDLVAGRSLPNDVERAQSDYTEWLIELVKSSGLRAPKWSFNNRDIPEKGVYHRFGFSVSGSGTIENLTRLLYSFYEKDYLHRITLLKISPVANAPNQLNLTLGGEVLAMEAASGKQTPPDWISPRITKTFEEYKNSIVQRNLFSPANHPPTWPATVGQQAVKGSAFSYRPSAKDSDPGQRLRYEILSKAPEGMRISSGGEEVTWIPKELGKYEIELLVVDSGIPEGWSTQKLTIDVVDPPPPSEPPKPTPKYDIAQQAEVSALVTGRNGPEAWIRSKLEGKTLFLKVGDKLSLGSVEGTVVELGANYMEVETEGKRWTVGLDESLADAYRRMKVD